ncbi:hypothetical protein CAEBREN_10880 [Caenorhabditis brenneri]|uniref:Uncharacterized protein n=1 Tax=Caenorhabditis brenneri TaxID=135651 RepID=G0MJP6_CAEBE|nr:hypothetical protein CAEBREN_10880 [Caenorhabditis brenneri]
MNLENSTESLYDLLKEYVGNQMGEERRGEEFRKSNQEGAANFFLNVLKVLALIITAFLLHYLWLYWKSGRVGPVTRIPKVIINQKYLKEEKYTKNPEWKCLIEYSGDDRNMCTGKVDDILRMKSGTETEQSEVPPSYSSLSIA